MKMKSCMLFILFSATILLLGLKVNGQDEDFLEIVIPPKAKLIDSNGNTAFLTKEEHHRFIRRPNACKIPPSLDNSELKCKLFPSKVECNQTCIFGHTFSEGIQRTMKCKYEEDRWHPSKDFENCKLDDDDTIFCNRIHREDFASYVNDVFNIVANMSIGEVSDDGRLTRNPMNNYSKKAFVDCNLSYGPGAYAKCYTNHMHKGPSCEVRCEHYEDKEAVPSAMYQCDIEGRWTPKLPFCVKAGSGQKLASRPRGRKMLKK